MALDRPSVRNLAPLVLAACLSASAQDAGPPPCEPVPATICEELERTYQEGKTTLESSESESAKDRNGKFNLGLPNLGVGVGGQAQSTSSESNSQSSTNVALSREILDKLATLKGLCNAAANAPSRMTVPAFWTTWQIFVAPEAPTVTCAYRPAVPAPSAAPVTAPVPAVAPEGVRTPVEASERKGVTLDLDLGVPTGVRIGGRVGKNKQGAVGVRAGLGVGLLYGTSSYAVGVVGAFARVPVDPNGIVSLEPSLNFAMLISSSIYPGATLGLDLRLRAPAKSGPRIGLVGGAQFGVAASGALLVPDIGVSLSW